MAQHRLDAHERRFVIGAFVAHIAASFALVIYHEHIYQGGDMLLYAELGKQLAYAMDVNFGRWAPEVLKLALQLDSDLPVDVILPGTSTGTMSALTGLVMFVVGENLYGVCLAISFFSFFGATSLYRAVRWKLQPSERQPALVGILLLPSVLFWSAGIVKEAFVVGFVGLVCKGLVDLLARRRVLAIVPLFVGLEGIALTKPYVLVSLAAAVGAWFYAGRGQKLGFAYKALGGVVVAVGIFLVAQRFPELSPENVFDQITQKRQNFDLVEQGGSNISLGDGDAAPSLGGNLKWAPLGLLNSLARPFLFEARNFSMAIAAFEMTAIVVVIVQVVRRMGARTIARHVASDPILLSAAVFVLTFATSVGLATKNLGSLSRYRVPMMPMYAAAVLVLRARVSARKSAVRPRSAPSERGGAARRTGAGGLSPAVRGGRALTAPRRR